MDSTKETYLDFLKKWFATKSHADPCFSLRAFARLVDIDPGLLSRILSGKRHPSLKCSYHVAQKMELSPEEIKRFVESVMEERNRSSLERIYNRQAPDQMPLVNGSKVGEDG